MNVERRFVLKGMALSSLAGIAMSSAGISAANSALGTQPQPARPTLVLVSSAAAQAAFLQGVNASPAGEQVKVRRTDLSLDFILGFEKRLRIATPQRIIGLVDDASAALIVDLARSAGAHVQWLGQHHAAAHASHHRLLSGETASGCAPQLGLSLNACGAGFSLTEHRLRGQQPPLRASAAGRDKGASDQWAATLGYALATLGTTHIGQAPVVDNRSAALTGHFVSLSIEA